MGEKNRHFSREFKRDAVQLVTEKGMPVGKVARELDIHPNLLHLWRRRFLAKGDKAFVGKGRVTPRFLKIGASKLGEDFRAFRGALPMEAPKLLLKFKFSPRIV